MTIYHDNEWIDQNFKPEEIEVYGNFDHQKVLDFAKDYHQHMTAKTAEYDSGRRKMLADIESTPIDQFINLLELHPDQIIEHYNDKNNSN